MLCVSRCISETVKYVILVDESDVITIIILVGAETVLLLLPLLPFQQHEPS
jgi:hypothetical protein